MVAAPAAAVAPAKVEAKEESGESDKDMGFGLWLITKQPAQQALLVKQENKVLLVFKNNNNNNNIYKVLQGVTGSLLNGYYKTQSLGWRNKQCKLVESSIIYLTFCTLSQYFFVRIGVCDKILSIFGIGGYLFFLEGLKYYKTWIFTYFKNTLFHSIMNATGFQKKIDVFTFGKWL